MIEGISGRAWTVCALLIHRTKLETVGYLNSKAVATSESKRKIREEILFFWKDLLTLLWWSGKLQVVSLKPGDDIWILSPSASPVSYSDITRIFASVVIVITCFLPVSWLFAAPLYNGLYCIHFCQNPLYSSLCPSVPPNGPGLLRVRVRLFSDVLVSLYLDRWLQEGV